MYFIISIDTEEDNWDNFHHDPSLENIRRIPQLQKMFDKYNVRPTYLITYPVASSREAVSILKPFHQSSVGEIGTHLHPWNTPPVDEARSIKNTMLNNLDADIQFKKLEKLHNKIEDSFAFSPVSFRAGRYGLNADLVKNLLKLNYTIESSITPFMDWRSFFGPDYSNFVQTEPYLLSSDDLKKEDQNSSILEVPLSIGYEQKDFVSSNSLFNRLKVPPFNYFKLIGLLARFGRLNKVRLTPEGYSFKEMKKLVDAMQRNGFRYYNLSFHSNSLLPGCTPFVTSDKDHEVFINKLEYIINYFCECGFVSLTLSEVFHHYNQDN